MNIYHVERTDGGGSYDTFSDFVCVAKSENQARKIHPKNSRGYSEKVVDENIDIYDTWVKLSNTKATLIGVANPKYTKNIIICASFHAG